MLVGDQGFSVQRLYLKPEAVVTAWVRSRGTKCSEPEQVRFWGEAEVNGGNHKCRIECRRHHEVK